LAYHGGIMANVLDDKIRELVGIAASVAGGCEPCLKYHVGAARKIGCSIAEMNEAVEIAQMVKQSPIKSMEELVKKLLPK